MRRMGESSPAQQLMKPQQNHDNAGDETGVGFEPDGAKFLANQNANTNGEETKNGAGRAGAEGVEFPEAGGEAIGKAVEGKRDAEYERFKNADGPGMIEVGTFGVAKNVAERGVCMVGRG